jgi:hypothetical protein
MNAATDHPESAHDLPREPRHRPRDPTTLSGQAARGPADANRYPGSSTT